MFVVWIVGLVPMEKRLCVNFFLFPAASCAMIKGHGFLCRDRALSAHGEMGGSYFYGVYALLQ
jgi:hypothetical protein